jgi:hypothetical protein
VIDQNIDEERNKIVYDLILTGCVDGLDYVARPWLPENLFNATGDRLRTDGRIAVVRLNDCLEPTRADQPVVPQHVVYRPSATKRASRDVVLIIRNDVYRSNIGYQGYLLGKLSFGKIFGRNNANKNTEGRTFTIGGEEFHVVSGPETAAGKPPKSKAPKPEIQTNERRPPSYTKLLEFSFNMAFSRFANSSFSRQDLSLGYPSSDGSFLNTVLSIPNAFTESHSWGAA